jgi:predicted amidohydrolase YtcJ
VLLPAPMGGSADDVRKGLAELRRPKSADPRLLNAIGVKIFADGVPPNRTAWLNEPYPEGGHGALCVHGATPALQVEGLREMIRLAHEAGFQLGVHVTGDRAIDTVVDAFVDAAEAAPRPDARHYVRMPCIPRDEPPPESGHASVSRSGGVSPASMPSPP